MVMSVVSLVVLMAVVLMAVVLMAVVLMAVVRCGAGMIMGLREGKLGIAVVF
jgi:hypothetical protein